jgi:ectoine hydroxylase-related dioxygenase (phytanoyl-CoA dioxygenase family)
MSAVAQPFNYRQPTLPLEDTARLANALHEDGFALIPGVLSQEEVQAARNAVDHLKPFGFDHMGATEHYKCVFNRDRYWLQFLDRPGIVDLAEATMGSECHIIGMTAWRSHPGHNGWGPHTDHTLVKVPEEVASDPERFPVYLCTAHYYLDEIDESLCPTWVIPGSHKSGTPLGWNSKEGFKPDDPEWNGKKLEPVLCKPGDVLFFRSEIWHTGSKNTSDRMRYLLQVHYSHRTIAQRFSPWPFTFNPEILSVANERQLRLLGKHPEGAYG